MARTRIVRWLAVIVTIAATACSDATDVDDVDAGSSVDASASDAGARDAGRDAGEGDADVTPIDADIAPIDAGITPIDAGTDAGVTPSDAGTDAGRDDAGPDDAGPPDAGPPDAGPPDAGPEDAGPPDAGEETVTCNEAGLVTTTRSGSASSGTPDGYTFDVAPGDPFCAEIVGGGSGTWGVTVSNGTTSGVYCSNVTRCAIRVPAGQTALMVTAITTDIGYYTLTVRRRPVP